MGDHYPQRVVVGVCKDPSCKDAIKWAIINKIKGPDDVLVLLHVVTKIPSQMGMEMFQSEVNNTMFVHYVRTVVQPLMLALKKLVDPSVRLELKVGRNNVREKGILDESVKLKATCLILGTNARMFSLRGKSASMGTFCVKNRPHGISVYVIQKEKIVLYKEAEGSPLSSSQSSPSASGRLSMGSGGGMPSNPGSTNSSGVLEPNYGGDSGNLNRSTSTSSGNEYEDDRMHHQSAHFIPKTASGVESEYAAQPYGQYSAQIAVQQRLQSFDNALGNTGSPQGSRRMSGAPPPGPERAPLGGRGWSPADDGAPPSYYPGQLYQPYGHQPSGGVTQGGSGSYVVGAQGMMGAAANMSDAQHGNALSSLAWQSAAADQQIQMEYLAEYEAWKKANSMASFQQQQEYMINLETRMAKAKAAMAGLSLDGGSGERPVLVPPPMAQAPSSGGSYGMSKMDGGMPGDESDLRRQYEMMRKMVEDAERARAEAERKAQRAIFEADKNVKEVEEQSKRKEMEIKLKMELASQEAMKARLLADEAKRKAEAEAAARSDGAPSGGNSRKGDDRNSKGMSAASANSSGKSVPTMPRNSTPYRMYSWEELMIATDNLSPSRKLGEGGFGTVYAGTLHHTPVAIKILKNSDAMQAANEFQQEVEVLCQIQHPHMVMLLGCCPERYALVYEQCANGSLEDRLMCAKGSPPLPWYIRMRIAAEISSALLILHSRPIPIVHRDLKPGNILLDKNFVAKLGDVGLAKLMPGLSMDQTYMRESVPVGTFAYVDPEFQRTGEFGPKSDVYALGIVLLDLLTGRTPNVYEGLEEAVDEEDEEKFSSYLDKKAGAWPVREALEVAKLAVKCSEMRRKKRPDLEKGVMPVLEKMREVATRAEEEEKRAFMGGGSRRNKDKKAPNSLCCPITQEIMVNPVLASDGYTYEKDAIENWLIKSDRSPMTNSKLTSKDLVPNHAVRSMIKEWHEMNG